METQSYLHKSSDNLINLSLATIYIAANADLPVLQYSSSTREKYSTVWRVLRYQKGRKSRQASWKICNLTVNLFSSRNFMKNDAPVIFFILFTFDIAQMSSRLNFVGVGYSNRFKEFLNKKLQKTDNIWKKK